MDQILGLVGGSGIPSLSGGLPVDPGLEISLGSATQLRLWSSTSEPERDEIINKSRFYPVWGWCREQIWVRVYEGRSKND